MFYKFEKDYDIRVKLENDDDDKLGGRGINFRPTGKFFFFLQALPKDFN